MEGDLHIIDYSELSKMNLPPVLYKYRSFSNPNHIKILTENSVYFAPPNSFEDPLDCRPPEVLPDGSVIWQHFWNISLKDYPDLSTETRLVYTEELIRNSPISDPDKIEGLLNSLFQDYCRCHGVLSLTADPNNEAMWNKYADNHQGFCVGFDSGKIAMISGGGGPVTYCDELPKILIWLDDLATEHVKRVFYKEKKWEFEKEYRLHRVWSLDALNNDVNRNVSLPDGSIVSIICGRNMPAENIANIRKILLHCHPNASISLEE